MIKLHINSKIKNVRIIKHIKRKNKRTANYEYSRVCKICKENFTTTKYNTWLYCEKCKSSNEYKNIINEIKRKREQSCIKKYGVTHCFYDKDALAKKEKTNLNRYGVKSTLSVDSVKDKIKQTNLQKYNSENVFGSKEIKEKMKKRRIDKYGVEYPMQRDDVKQKSKISIQNKYGKDHIAQTDFFKNAYEITSLKKYGVKHPFQSNIVKDKCKNTWLKKYGVDNVFKSEEIKTQIKQTTLANYGVEHPFESDVIKNRFKETCLLRFGVDNPFKSKQIQQKMIENSLLKYGCKYPVQSIEVLTKRFHNRHTYSFTKPHRKLKEAIDRDIINNNFLTEKIISLKTNNNKKRAFSVDEIDFDRKIIIFVDGDYWHANPKKYNADQKLRRNRIASTIWQHDKDINEKLQGAGYVVLRFWESDIKYDVNQCINKIKNVINNQQLQLVA